MKRVLLFAVFTTMLTCVCYGKEMSKTPVIVITDLYHPYQDPGDNLDLINGFALPDVDLLGVIIDGSDYFRKDTADHPTLWRDPRGPRECGIVPVCQMNYIFKQNVPYGIGPLSMTKSEDDKMSDLTAFENGVDLFIQLLAQAKQPVEVLSFGSARVVAVALNREPELLRKKIRRVHISGGTATKNHQMGSDTGANMIPGGEWNVALDVFAFTRLLRSNLPIALYPCAGKDGGFVKDVNNTYWKMWRMDFLKDMSPKLQSYIGYAFTMSRAYDFLRQMDYRAPYSTGEIAPNEYFHIWETAIWLEATSRKVVKSTDGSYSIKRKCEVNADDKVLVSQLRPCNLTVRDDGRFEFEYTPKSNVTIYYRSDVDENENALNEAVPKLFISYRP